MNFITNMILLLMIVFSFEACNEKDNYECYVKSALFDNHVFYAQEGGW